MTQNDTAKHQKAQEGQLSYANVKTLYKPTAKIGKARRNAQHSALRIFSAIEVLL